MARSSRIVAALSLCAVLALSGCDGPTAPPEDDLEPPAPAFLIGQSPLIILVNDPTDPTTLPFVRITADLNRGIFTAKAEDRFWIRSTVTFSKGGVDVVGLQPCIDKPTPAKQTELNRGGSVAVIMDINIPTPAWDAIINATPQGDMIDVHAKIELLLVDGAGKTHVLDTTDATGSVDPHTTV